MTHAISATAQLPASVSSSSRLSQRARQTAAHPGAPWCGANARGCVHVSTRVLVLWCLTGVAWALLCVHLFVHNTTAAHIFRGRCAPVLRASTDNAGDAFAGAAAAAGDAAASALKMLWGSQQEGGVPSPAAPLSLSGAPVLPVVTDTDLEDEVADLNLKVEDRLGKGSRATVFRCVGGNLRSPPGAAKPPWRASPGEVVAVKALVGEVTPDSLAELTSEAALWRQLDHPGIVRVYHATLAPVPLLVLEACEEGTLFAALRRPGALDVRPLAVDVASALAAVHAAGQAHRDVKSANVLLTRTGGRLQAKLCDWGSAAPMQSSLPSRPAPPGWPSALFGSSAGPKAPTTWTPVGTALWMAPEMLQPHYQGTAPQPGASGATADVHSFGVLLWEMLERRLPWVEGTKVNRAEVLRVVVKEQRRLPLAPWVHPDLAALITQCWHVDPKQRPSMAQVAQRLQALPAWDTDGHLDRVAAGKVPVPSTSGAAANKVPGLGTAMRIAVFGGGGAAAPKAAAVASPAKQPASRAPAAPVVAEPEDEEERLTLSETVPEVESDGAPKPSAQALAASMAQALAPPADGKKAVPAPSGSSTADVLLSSILPHAYGTVVSAPVKVELDALVVKMKALEVRVAQLEERRRYDPLAAVVGDGKKQELQDITAKVTAMRADAAVKAWAHVNALLAEASASAAKEYAAARRLADESKKAAPPAARRRSR